MRKLLALSILIVIVGSAWWMATYPRQSSAPSPVFSPSAPATAEPETALPAAEPPPPLAPRLPGVSANAPLIPAARLPSDPAHSAPPPAPLTAAAAATPDVRTDLEEVLTAIRDFRSNLGGNPVGTNAEITKALLGDNLKQIRIPVPTGSSLNANGELCDRWGTPYFFHQLSRDKMEVRSAGPDRQMWTSDDRQM
jgi:hypothetical protein